LFLQQVELFGVGVFFTTVLDGQHRVGLGDGCGDVFFGTLVRLFAQECFDLADVTAQIKCYRSN